MLPRQVGRGVLHSPVAPAAALLQSGFSVPGAKNAAGRKSGPPGV